MSKRWNGNGFIEDVTVDRAFRGCGIGRRLMDAAVRWERKRVFPAFRWRHRIGIFWPAVFICGMVLNWEVWIRGCIQALTQGRTIWRQSKIFLFQTMERGMLQYLRSAPLFILSGYYGILLTRNSLENYLMAVYC